MATTPETTAFERGVRPNLCPACSCPTRPDAVPELSAPIQHAQDRIGALGCKIDRRGTSGLTRNGLNTGEGYVRAESELCRLSCNDKRRSFVGAPRRQAMDASTRPRPGARWQSL